MARVQPVDPNKVDGDIQRIFQSLKEKLGRVPNIFLTMGHSLATLKGYLALADAAGQTSLSPKIREQIALVVSQKNSCQYCLAAHQAIAKGTGLLEQEIRQARLGHAEDPKTTAILKFAATIVEKRGLVSDQDVKDLKKGGVSDKELDEIILIVFQTMFTNYFNHITDPDIDFPRASEIL